LRLNQLKHKEIIRLINSNQSDTNNLTEKMVDREQKEEQKRVVNKKGR